MRYLIVRFRRQRCLVLILLIGSMSWFTGCGLKNVDSESVLPTSNVPPTIAVVSETSSPSENTMNKVRHSDEPTPSITPEPTLSLNPEKTAIAEYWDQFGPTLFGKDNVLQVTSSDRYGEISNNDKEYPVSYYLTGLIHTDANVRWFCAYKLSEFSDQLSDEEKNSILPLLNDINADVRKAAAFTKSIFDETYAGDTFVHSPDGKSIVYYKYREARYNDGAIWLVTTEGENRLLYKNLNINALNFSPDSKLLAVGSNGREWIALEIIDVATGKPLELPDFIMPIIQDPLNGYDMDINSKEKPVIRFDPYVTLIEWAPEGKRFLYSYRFSDAIGNDFNGYAIFDLKQNRTIKVYPNMDRAENPLPDGFTW
jgi:WD40 repeat protein